MYGNDLDEWISFLIERVRLLKSIRMAQLLKEKYIINNVIRYREPREYVIIIIYIVKVVKLNTMHNQLDIIQNSLNIKFQFDINLLNILTSLN